MNPQERIMNRQNKGKSHTKAYVAINHSFNIGRKDNLLTILMRSCLSFHLILSIGIGCSTLIAVLAKVACNEK